MRANRLLLSFFMCSSTLLSLPAAQAQVHESAVGASHNLWVGLEVSDFNPDYNFFRLYGAGLYGDYNITRNVGIEGEARVLNFTHAAGQNQKSLLGGPTYTFYRYHRFTFNAKVLLGGVKIVYPDGIGYGSYFAFAPGGNAEYRLTSRLKVRGEYEFEFLPSAPGFPGQTSNGLTPNGFNIGVSYRVF